MSNCGARRPKRRDHNRANRQWSLARAVAAGSNSTGRAPSTNNPLVAVNNEPALQTACLEFRLLVCMKWKYDLFVLCVWVCLFVCLFVCLLFICFVFCYCFVLFVFVLFCFLFHLNSCFVSEMWFFFFFFFSFLLSFNLSTYVSVYFFNLYLIHWFGCIYLYIFFFFLSFFLVFNNSFI